MFKVLLVLVASWFVVSPVQAATADEPHELTWIRKVSNTGTNPIEFEWLTGKRSFDNLANCNAARNVMIGIKKSPAVEGAGTDLIQTEAYCDHIPATRFMVMPQQ